MIQIPRTPCPPSLDPNNATASGPKELRKISAMMAAEEKVLSKDFGAFGSRAVRDALRTMFNGKCAYCESKIAGSQDTDVEHYRPKKGVTEAKTAGVDHPGYWWLAMVWENLVLSCQHCNQSRKEQVIIPDHIESIEDLEAFLMNPPRTRSGKLNAFPTENDSWATAPTHDIDLEKPMLLNPVDTDPEDHLEWVLLAGASTVRAKNNSSVGEASRKILGLNRRWLEEERRIQLRQLQAERNDIIAAINDWITAESDVLAEVHAKVADKAIRRLRNRTAPEQPFAGLARAFLTLVQTEVDEMLN